MQKVFMMCILALAGITGKVCAQSTSTFPFDPPPASRVFEVPNPGWLRHHFVIELAKGNRIKIELVDQQGLEYLANLDSLLQSCTAKIMLLKDSFNNELTNIRIDYAINKKGNHKIRMQRNQPVVNSYALQDNELYAMKLAQDSIVIVGSYQANNPVSWSKKPIYLAMGYRVSITLNHIRELEALGQLKLNEQVQAIKRDWNQYVANGSKDYAARWTNGLSALYSTVDTVRNQPIKLRGINDGVKRALLPYIGFALQNMQHYFTPSVQLGLDLSFLNGKEHGNHYLLYIEKYFFRESGKNKLLVNNFICFQFRNVSPEINQGGKALDYTLQFSLGYLATRSGNYFEKNSFRLSLPGLNYKNLQLTPGLFFNNLFKQTSPSIALTVYLQ